MRCWWVLSFAVLISCSTTPATTTTTVAATTTTVAPTTSTTSLPSTTTSTTDVELVVPEGYLLHDHQALGFGLALPESWRASVLPTLRPDLALQDLKDKDFRAALATRMEVTAKAGGIFFAYDTKKPTVNLNLFVQPVVAPAEGEPAARNALATAGATNLEVGLVDLPIGVAVQVKYELSVELDDGPTVETYGEVYLLTGPGWTAELTMAGSAKEASAGRFKKIASTVRLYPRPEI